MTTKSKPKRKKPKRKKPIKHMRYYRVVRPGTCDDVIILARTAYEACNQLGWDMRDCSVTYYEKHHSRLLNKLFRAYEIGPCIEIRVGDTVKIRKGFPDCGLIGQVKSINKDSGLYTIRICGSSLIQMDWCKLPKNAFELIPPQLEED